MTIMKMIRLELTSPVVNWGTVENNDFVAT